MLTYSFDNRNGRSLYEYLYTCIKNDIISGKLTPDTKLPSKRDFAKNHGISVVTVENTYGQLLAEGYIYSLPKKGFYVSAISNDMNQNIYPIIRTDDYMNKNHTLNSYTYSDYNTSDNDNIYNTYNPYNPDNNSDNNNNNNINNNYNNNNNNINNTYNTGNYINTSGTSTLNDINTRNQAAGLNYINLVSSHTPHENFPFSIWAKLMRHVLTYESDDTLNVPPTGGVMKLRRAIAHHLYEFRGITVNPEQIIIGAGTEYLYGLIVQLLGRNLSYGLENPSSKKIVNIYKSLGVRVNYLDMDEEGVVPDCEGLNNSQIIQISPSHHFPTGIVTSISRRYGLLQWANQSVNRYIIEDDYDSEFRLQGKPIPSLFSIDATDKVIYFNTFTKSLASTIRISYMVLPLPLLKRFKDTLGFYACTVSNFEQYTLAHFIEEGYLDKHINRMRNHYRDIRDELIAELMNSPIKDRIHIYEENSGLHFLLQYDTTDNDEELKKRACKNGLLISFLSDYITHNAYDKKNYEHIAVVNYSGITSDDVKRTAMQLTDILCESN